MQSTFAPRLISLSIRRNKFSFDLAPFGKDLVQVDSEFDLFLPLAPLLE